MNLNDLKIEKKKLQQEKNKQNVLTLHEMFPSYDLPTLAAFYLQANKNLDGAISLLLSLQADSSSVAENNSNFSTTDVSTTVTLAATSKSSSKPSRDLRSDQRIVLLSSFFPYRTFTHEEIDQVLQRCNGNVNMGLVLLMDMFDERRSNGVNEQREMERRIENDSSVNVERQMMEELQDVELLDSQSVVEMSATERDNMKQFANILDHMCEHYLSSDESSGEEDEMEENGDGNNDDDDNDDDNDGHGGQIVINDEGEDGEQFEIVSNDTMIDNDVFSTTMDEEMEKLQLKKLQQLVEEQERIEREMLQILEKELNEQELMDGLMRQKQKKQEEFDQMVIEKNFTRKEESDEYKRSLIIAKQPWKYSNVESIDDRFKELVKSNFTSHGHQYLGEITSLMNKLASFKNVYVQSVYSEELAQRFAFKLERIKSVYPQAGIRFAFHGTASTNVSNIVHDGFLKPGDDGFKHATDSGWYGAGIYLSPSASVSISYCRGGGKLLVCATIPGRVYRCETRRSKGCHVGFDSHLSPYGDEIVLFDSAQVLPLYVIHFPSVRHSLPYLGFRQHDRGHVVQLQKRYLRKRAENYKAKTRANSDQANSVTGGSRLKSSMRNDGAHRLVSANRRKPREKPKDNQTDSNQQDDKTTQPTL